MMGVSSDHMQEVLSSVRTQHYHIACTRVYEITHGLRKGEGFGGDETVTHPNEYCQRSRELEKSKNAAAADDAMKTD